MSKPDMARGWDFAMNLLAEKEIARIDAMSDDDVARELRAEGVHPSDIPSAEQLVAQADGRSAARREAPPVSAVLRAPPRRVPVVVWLLAAALGAVVIAAVSTKVPQVIARWHGPPAPSAAPSALPRAIPATRAAALRNDAARACEHALWETCAQRLDDARSLDPMGELDERVTRMRADITAHRDQKPGALDAKPGPNDPPRR